MLVTLSNNISFNCKDDETILEAAIKSGINIEHSCKNGRCNSCKARVVSGNALKIKDNIILDENDLSNNIILTCCYGVNENTTLNISSIEEEFPKATTFPVKIDSIIKLNANTLKLIIRFPPSITFKYLSGQYLNLSYFNISRSYSIVNSTNNSIELIIKNYPDGEMSSYLFNSAKQNDMLRVKGPLGTFHLKETSKDHIYLIATGTGIAPFISFIESEINKNIITNKKITIVWGVRNEEDLYWKPYLNDLQFIPTLSKPNNNWKGHIGYVQDTLSELNIDFENSDFYLCGSLNMIKELSNKLIENNVSETNIHTDAFVKSN